MASTFIGISEAHNNSTGSLTLAQPSGSPTTGDFFIALLLDPNFGDTITAPGGWSAATGSPFRQVNGIDDLFVFYRFQTSGSFTFSGFSTGGAEYEGMILCYRGIDNTTPVNKVQFKDFAGGTLTGLTTNTATYTGTNLRAIVAWMTENGEDPFTGISGALTQRTSGTIPYQYAGDEAYSSGSPYPTRTASAANNFNGVASLVILLNEAASGSAFTVTKSDTATASDADTINQGHVFTKTDTATASDADTINQGRVFTKTDTATASDADTLNGTFAKTKADTVTAGDSANVNNTTSKTEADTVTASDAYAVASSHALVKADTATASDTYATASAHALTEADTVSVSDAHQLATKDTVVIGDTATASDVVQLAQDIALVFADSVTPADSAQPATVPHAVLISPLPEQVNVSPSTPVVFDLTDGAGSPIDYDTVVVTVNSIEVWQDGGPVAGWTGRVDMRSGARRYSLFAPTGFVRGSRVTVNVTFNYSQNTALMFADAVTPTDATAKDVRLVSVVQNDTVSASDAVTVSVTRAISKTDTVTAVDTYATKTNVIVFNHRIGKADSARSIALTNFGDVGVGDLLVVNVAASTNGASAALAVTPPAGWTQIRLDHDAAFTCIASFYKVATSTEVSAGSFTFSFSGLSNFNIRGALVGLRSFDAVTPLGPSSGAVSSSLTSSISITGVTMAESGRVLVFALADEATSIGDDISCAGMQLLDSAHGNTESESYASFTEARAAGATGSRTPSWTVTYHSGAHLITVYDA